MNFETMRPYKIDVIFQMTYSSAFYLFQISVVNFNNNNTTSIQILAWCKTGNKPLSETITALFSDA